MPILTLLGQCAAMGGASMAVGSIPLVFKDSMSRECLCFDVVSICLFSDHAGRRRFLIVLDAWERLERGGGNAPARASDRDGDVTDRGPARSYSFRPRVAEGPLRSSLPDAESLKRRITLVAQ